LEQNSKFSKSLIETEAELRDYLLNKTTDIPKDIHLFITDISESDNIPVKRFNLYMARGIDGTVGSSSTECIIYAKFVRFCIFMYTTPYDETKWINTKIISGTSNIQIPQQILDNGIGDFLVDRVRGAMNRYNSGLSERQRTKIIEYQKRILPQIIDSDFGKALLSDSFGKIDKSYFPKRISRNDMCPCGSGIKYKKCCGK
jgi:hypothetical protein